MLVESSRLVGAYEAMHLLGRPRSNLAYYRRSLDFPPPLLVLRATPIWLLDGVEDWRDERMTEHYVAPTRRPWEHL
jgi:hypothetical protein